MILSDRDIRAAQGNGINIDPFSDELVQPASYDLRVGNRAACASNKQVTDLAEAGFVEIKPGDFVIVTTYERIELSARHVGRFGLTSTHARKGLIATVGAQIDPGFHGRLTVGLTNLSAKPVILPHKDIFLTTEFHRLEQDVETSYSGPYQDRDELSPEDIKIVMEREYMSQTEMMRTLESLVTTVESLKQSINWRLSLALAIIVTLVFATTKYLW